VTSETDYSIHRAPGTGEISGFRTVSNREEDRRKGRRARKGKREGAHADDEEDAVQVELTDQRPDPQAEPETPGPDRETDNSESVDVLA